MIVPPVYAPKNAKVKHSRKETVRKYDDHDFINEVFMFWTFKSDHLEFLNTLPKDVKVDLSLLFLSKKIFKYPRVLWWNLLLLLYDEVKKFSSLSKYLKC